MKRFLLVLAVVALAAAPALAQPTATETPTSTPTNTFTPTRTKTPGGRPQLLTEGKALAGNFGTTNGGVVVQAKRGSIGWTATTATALFTLPAGAVPLEVLVDVTTTFNDSGTDVIDVGKTGTGDFFVADVAVTSTGRKVPTRTNLGVSVGTSAVTVTAIYAGQNGDASAGAATITVLYLVP